jgi:hypothetical protein
MSNKSLAVLDNAIRSKKFRNKPYVIIPKVEAKVILSTQAQQKVLLEEQQAYIEELEMKLRTIGELL